MSNYLLDYARSNIWCNPRQDNQLVFAAKRITKKIGALNSFSLMHRTVTLPTPATRYHVFQIGQIDPNMLGLLTDNPSWLNERWIKFSDAINDLKLVINLYNDTGVEIPRFKSYYMYSNERGLIFAVEEDSRIPLNFREETIYLRLYTNAYFHSARVSESLDLEYISCKGYEIETSGQILTIQAEYEAVNTLPGYVFCFRNGMNVDRLDAITMKIGDIVEYVYDSSVKRIVTFSVADLHSFDSTLDNKFKYLLHYNDGSNDTIDYHDDIDVYVLGPKFTTRLEGCYYHRNAVDSHRMVTHRDYSIVGEYFTNIFDKVSQVISATPLDPMDFKIRVTIRDAGLYRPLVYDHSRIFELYKLNDTLALQTMVGIDANIDIWQAASLENNTYTRLMRAKYNEIDMPLVQAAMGYNSISKLLGDTPSKTTTMGANKVAQLPYNLQNNATIYEYASDGYLLGVQTHLDGETYVASTNSVAMIEAISGIGSQQPEVIFGSDNLPLPTNCNYRVYRCYLFNDVPDNNWQDITGSEYYSVVNNTLVWNNLDSGQFLMIRNDKTFLDYEITLAATQGTLFFTLTELEDRGDGVLEYTLPVPLGELDLFMNGKSLIRGIDYIIQFPKVYIINKKFLQQPVDSVSQTVHVRFTGFCNSDLTLDTIEDVGYIEHGVFSNNNKFDIRDDKVMRITLNGAMKHRDDIIFSELHSGISVTDPINGHPYQIKDIVVPLRDLVADDTYNMRQASIVIDDKISDYLSVKLPQPTRNAINAIVERYPLYSPFFSRIITGLINGSVTGNFIKNLTDKEITDICKPFEYILEFDPIVSGAPIDHRYVIVHPVIGENVVNLSIYKYKFLSRVVTLYGRGRIDISSFVTLTI